MLQYKWEKCVKNSKNEMFEFFSVCIPCLLIGGEPRLPLEYFRKRVLAARGDQGSWDHLNDAIGKEKLRF